jgi:hypothetical protein
MRALSSSPLFRYLVRQRAAFLDGIRPPDFCEGAVDKTCVECIFFFVFFLAISGAHSTRFQSHRNGPSAAQNRVEGFGVGWTTHDVRFLCSLCSQQVRSLRVTLFAWALKNIPTLRMRKRSSCYTCATPSCFRLVQLHSVVPESLTSRSPHL